MIASPPPPSSRPKPRVLARRSGETPVFFRLLQKRTRTASTFCFGALLTATTLAQSPQPLPANYRTILDNPDVLVMRVHYGPHEFVPLHDHSAYPTLYVYLNDSGVIQIDHAPPDTFSVKRPPTHTGAFRVAPGMTERHSITNLSDLPSDFLRVELKSIPPHAIKEVFRGSEPSSPLTPGLTVAYKSPSFRIDRILCAPPAPCTLNSDPAPSLVVLIPLNPASAPGPSTAAASWFPANPVTSVKLKAKLKAPFEVLRILFPRH